MDNSKSAADATKNAADKAQAQAKSVLDTASGRTQEAMEKSARVVEEMNDFGKGNVDAFVEASKIAANGFEALSQDAAAFARKSYDDATQAMKSMASAKSPTEFFKLQSDYARTAFDSVVAQTSKQTERMFKLAGEVAQPISNRASLATEKVKLAA